MLVNQKDIMAVENGKVDGKHLYRPILCLSWSKEKTEDIPVEQLRTPEEQEVCCMATD